jgi:hypothetical protein
VERTELDILIEQLDELLGAGIQEPDEALELATIAGLAVRLGAPEDALEEAEVWRDESDDLLDAAFAETDLDEILETLDNLELADETEVDEAVSDFDDLVAAAAWCGRADSLRAASRAVAAIVRRVPDPFACLTSDAQSMLATDTVAGDLALYDYWVAIRDAGEWS